MLGYRGHQERRVEPVREGVLTHHRAVQSDSLPPWATEQVASEDPGPATASRWRVLPDTQAGFSAAALDERVAAALRAALAPNTWRAYAADWRQWSAWATQYGVAALPAEPLALARYLVDQATTTRIGTLTRRLSAVAKAHVLAGHVDPLTT